MDCQIHRVQEWRANAKQCSAFGTFHLVADPPLYLCRKHLGSGVQRMVKADSYVVVRYA